MLIAPFLYLTSMVDDYLRMMEYLVGYSFKSRVVTVISNFVLRLALVVFFVYILRLTLIGVLLSILLDTAFGCLCRYA